MNGGREAQGIASGASIKTCPMKMVSKLEPVKGCAGSSGQVGRVFQAEQIQVWSHTPGENSIAENFSVLAVLMSPARGDMGKSSWESIGMWLESCPRDLAFL